MLCVQVQRTTIAAVLLMMVWGCQGGGDATARDAGSQAAGDAEAAAAVQPERYDVVIYGGTSGGVTAAVQAADMGKSVAIVNHYGHVGGLTSGGLGRTDTGRRGVIGGLSRGFYERVWQYYQDEDRWEHETRDEYVQHSPLLRGDADAQYGFEPHVAERIFHEMLDEAEVTLISDEFLVRDGGSGVVKDGNRIEAIVTESGRRFEAGMFIDATYEGDLLAEAGVSYIVGREGNDVYGETLNGVQRENATNHVFTHKGQRPHPPRPLPEEARVDPYVVEGDPSSGLLPGVNPGIEEAEGEGDARVQSYCYRLCLTDVEENMVPFEPPEGFDEADFELLFRMFEAGEERIPWLPGAMPNRKTDTNNRWAVSMNLIGGSKDYPEASYARRREIEQEHEYWQRGLMYLLANHPRVPEHVREEVSQWGYAADEFTDNDHWPYAIYVRVGRRMVSDYVMTEQDCRLQRVAEDPVGFGSYNMDSHNVQRYVTEEGYVQNEGNIEVPPAGPYAISYRSIVPTEDEAANLLVPVAVSSSHIAFGSIRMEPVFMILGQSAGTAAVHALQEETSVQQIDYDRLHERLVADGQAFPEVRQPTRAEDLEGLAMDHVDAEVIGNWSTGSSVPEFVGTTYLHDGNTGKGEKRAVYAFAIEEAGDYAVHVSYSQHHNRATNVPVTIHHADGEATVQVDQTQPPEIDDLFTSVGTFRFTDEEPARVVIGTADTDGHVIVDAVRLLPADDADSDD